MELCESAFQSAQAKACGYPNLLPKPAIATKLDSEYFGRRNIHVVLILFREVRR